MQRLTRHLLLPLLLLLLALALTACGGTEEQTPDVPDITDPSATGESDPTEYAAILEGDPAQDFTIQLTDGTDFTLSDHLGQVVLLNFWATWCTYCVMEMPAFDMLQEAYGDDLAILAVNCDVEAETALDFLEENDYGFPIALDTDQTVSSLYPTDALPYTLVIDREGHVIHTVLGGGEPEEVFARFQGLIDPLLAE